MSLSLVCQIWPSRLVFQPPVPLIWLRASSHDPWRSWGMTLLVWIVHLQKQFELTGSHSMKRYPTVAGMELKIDIPLNQRQISQRIRYCRYLIAPNIHVDIPNCQRQISQSTKNRYPKESKISYSTKYTCRYPKLPKIDISLHQSRYHKASKIDNWFIGGYIVNSSIYILSLCNEI